MARPLRIEYAGAVYHVTSRGDRREAIYLDDVDREKWLEIFGSVCERFNWRCYAWVQMDNHYHLMVETVDGNLSQGMRQLNGVYTQAHNRRHNRVGHVFQGRFKGILVDYFSEGVDRALGIAAAYRSGDYSQKEIADYCGIHYSTVSRSLRDQGMKNHE